MARSLAWHLNLDADRELQAPSSYRASSLTAERVRELVTRMSDLVAPDDLQLDAISGGELPTGVTIQAFCPTPSALAQIRKRGFTPPPAPTLEVLRAVNDRAFCAALGHGLPGAAFVRDMTQLERQLEQPVPGGRYVIKRAFSFAGREQKRVAQGPIDEATRKFCARSFAREEGLQVEPWVDRLADFSRHGYLTSVGTFIAGPARAQNCDPMGRFLGMSKLPAELSEIEDASLIAELAKTAAALEAAHYFGPFGIDAFRYRDANRQIQWNPRCEINARLTMGYPRALLLDGLDRERRVVNL
jgi:hypothetical protein